MWFAWNFGALPDPWGAAMAGLALAAICTIGLGIFPNVWTALLESGLTQIAMR
jgi:hypothetical protein